MQDYKRFLLRDAERSAELSLGEAKNICHLYKIYTFKNWYFLLYYTQLQCSVSQV